MSRQILFNGSVLTRPGAATKIDASQFEGIALGGNGTVALIGEADGGPPHSLQIFSGQMGASAGKEVFGSGDLVEAIAIVSDPLNDERIPTGAQTIVCWKTNNSTQASLTKTPHVFRSKQWGVGTNNITMAISAGSGSSRVVTISGGVTLVDLSGDVIVEVSPELGGSGKFTLQYIGSGSAATVTISATQLAVTVTGASDSITILFSDYPTLDKVIARLNNTGVFSAIALITNAAVFDATYLDAVSALDVMTSVQTLYAQNFDILDWINSNSNIVYDDTASYTKGTTAPMATFTATALSGGTRGTTTNTDWLNAFSGIQSIRVNQVVPLISADGIGTYDTVLADLTAHCKLMSSTAGRSEREGWSGASKTKSALIAAANAQNSPHVVVLGQKLMRLQVATQQIAFLPEWSAATALAGGRAGASLKEPLTWKYVNCQGVSSDSSWAESNNDDVTDLELNGVVVINSIPGKGFRIDKCITTYTRSDNDAFAQESIVQIWKNYSFDLRTALEDRFVGRAGNLDDVRSVPTVIDEVSKKYEDAGAITKTVAADGTVSPAWRNVTVLLSGNTLSVGVTIVVTPGIDFIPITITLLPAVINV